MSRLIVIIGSTRPGRAGLPVAEWFVELAGGSGSFQVDVADLAELALPLLDEPNHPRLGRYEHEHTKRWSTRVAAADAVVIVTPEYNSGYPAPIKNAIDYLHTEWRDKAVGFVSYGGVSAGTRAVQQLKQVVTTLRMVPVVDAVSIPFHTQFFDAEGRFRPNATLVEAATAMVDELQRLDGVLRQLRRPAPSPA